MKMRYRIVDKLQLLGLPSEEAYAIVNHLQGSELKGYMDPQSPPPDTRKLGIQACLDSEFDGVILENHNLWVLAKESAFIWLSETHPGHWALPMFAFEFSPMMNAQVGDIYESPEKFCESLSKALGIPVEMLAPNQSRYEFTPGYTQEFTPPVKFEPTFDAEGVSIFDGSKLQEIYGMKDLPAVGFAGTLDIPVQGARIVDPPVTIRDYLRKEIYDRGIFENQVDAIMAMIVPEGATAPLHDILEKSIKGYPDMVLMMSWITVKKIAADWLRDNTPQHWARPMFDDKLADELTSLRKEL